MGFDKFDRRILVRMLQKFFWRNSKFLFKRFQKMGIGVEAALAVNIRGAFVLLQQLLGIEQLLFQDKLMKGKACMLFKFPRDIVLAHIKILLHFL